MDDAIEIGALLLRLRTGGDSLPREGVEYGPTILS